jgi:hypothetical protein
MLKRRFDPKAAAMQAVLAAREAVGERLLGATLYGSAAGGGAGGGSAGGGSAGGADAPGATEFDPKRSDVNVAFVLSMLAPAELEALHPAFRRWTRLRVTRPLLLSEEDLARSLDTFPLEYLLIRERHETLHGRDYFADLAIDRAALRSEIERLLRTQELGLNWTYLSHAGTTSGAREWAARAATAVAASASGLLHLLGEPVPATRDALIGRAAARFGLEAPALALFFGGPRSARAEAGGEGAGAGEAISRGSGPVETGRVLAAAHAILTRLIEEVERLDTSTLHSR